MYILSLDSAGNACSACVWCDGRVLAEAREEMARGQDARLVPLTQNVMAKAGMTFDGLDRIAVTRGPGSFTGLRIGLAAARGFGLAANKPVVGVDRFMLYREQFNKADYDLLVVLESKRLELYCRLYPAQGKPQEACMLPPEDIAALVHKNTRLKIAGDAQEKMREFVLSDVEILSLRESEAATCALLASWADMNDPAFLPRPYYLRPPDVTLAKAGGRTSCPMS